METSALGLALIVGGAAFLCSGLVFLPTPQCHSSIEEDKGEISEGLQRMREERGDSS